MQEYNRNMVEQCLVRTRVIWRFPISSELFSLGYTNTVGRGWDNYVPGRELSFSIPSQVRGKRCKPSLPLSPDDTACVSFARPKEVGLDYFLCQCPVVSREEGKPEVLGAIAGEFRM